MSAPQDHVWLWVLRGFDGLFSLINKWLELGTPPTPALKEGLIQLRTKLDAMIDKIS